jgi:hypothetical protein
MQRSLTWITEEFAARPWEAASAAFFLYTLILALVLPRLDSVRRRWGVALAGAGLTVTWLSHIAAGSQLLHGWLIPPVLLLLAYWSSGSTFVAPMPRVERVLMRIDEALDVRAVGRRLPAAAATMLELAYAGVYPLIPLALVLHLTLTPSPDPSLFWTTVLVTDYMCFATLPWLQSRPPRSIESGEPWQSEVRRFNQGMLHASSIRANTFPSGHAAEALAAALLVIGAPAPIVAAMFAAALAVSAGAVLGRYHYALDAVLGWVVALGVWGAGFR